MADIFVGTSAAGSANGTSWANRYGTLNAAEDKPVVAGDRVICGPGVYRELLTVDVSGTAGNPIEYRADVSGELTDGIGGIVRITGSNNDTTATRANCITATSKDYRTFTGFAFDTVSSALITLVTACSNWIVQDCYFFGLGVNVNAISLAGTGTTNTIRRCVFVGGRGSCIAYSHGSTVNDTANVVENCIIVGPMNYGVVTTRVGGITVRNCSIISCSSGVLVATALAVGQTVTVNNCLFMWDINAVYGTVTGEIVENYNAFWGSSADRTNTATGANSNAFPALFNPLLLLSGFRLPQLPMFGLSEWSALRAITGTGMSSEDGYGIARPATDSKKGWGALQFPDVSREVTTVRTGSAALKLADAGAHQMFVPVTAVSTTFSVYVQWEADYAGTKPSLTIKQPGQSDTTGTATGSSGSWEELSITLTPAASPGYVVVELVSSNTGSGNIDVFFDDFVVN